MKKVITAMLVASMILAFASCGNNNTDETTTASTTTAETTTAETTTQAPAVTTEDAKTVLNNVYGNFLNKLAPLFGASSGEELYGYFASAETETITETDENGEEFSYEMPVSGPGALSLEEVDNLTYYTLFPAESVSKISSAACFFNMMNMNNGTVAAFEVKDAADVAALADTMKEKITTNMWICGFPERYLIVNVNGTLISAFGNADTINSLKDGVLATYADAVVLHDAAL